MIKKYQLETASTASTEEARKSILKEKDDNYSFLLLVQNKEYELAYELGKKILKKSPNNPSILKFCLFIEQNSDKLKKMVAQEKEYAYYTTDSEAEEEYDADSEEEEEEEYAESEDEVLSKSEEESESESKSKEKRRASPRKCDAHEWPHICNNPNCPNKNKNNNKSPSK